MAEPAKACTKCAYWDRGTCRHGLAAEAEHARAHDYACPFFARDVSAFGFFVKEWRW